MRDDDLTGENALMALVGMEPKLSPFKSSLREGAIHLDKMKNVMALAYNLEESESATLQTVLMKEVLAMTERALSSFQLALVHLENPQALVVKHSTSQGN